MELPDKGDAFEQCPAGTFSARCTRFVDMGSHKQTFQGEDKGLKRLVLLTFELPTEHMGDGRPFSTSKRYTWSVHEKANLRKDLESWRGKKFVDADFGNGGFDIKNVLGKGCTLTITHDEREGTVYSNITAIGALMKGVELPDQVNQSVYVALDKSLFNQMDFDQLSDNLKAKIQTTPEWARLNGQELEVSDSHDERNPPPMGGNDMDDEIPF